VSAPLRIFALFSVAFAVAACGGERDKGEEEATPAERALCTGGGMSGDTGLPATFPAPDAVVYVKASNQGPATLVDGRYEGDLDEAFEAYKDAFDRAGYTITKDEKEEDDAEVNYEGDGRSGQVALRAKCGEEDKLVVHITSRPA
jgi:hypothetical protein